MKYVTANKPSDHTKTSEEMIRNTGKISLDWWLAPNLTWLDIFTKRLIGLGPGCFLSKHRVQFHDYTFYAGSFVIQGAHDILFIAL